MAFGGADSLDAVEPFMINLMGGRSPSPELIERTKERYKIIGGGSPLAKITAEQARAVETILEKHGAYKVVTGMRYWHPFISEAIAELNKEDIKDIIAVSLSPHFSRISTGAYQNEILKVVDELGNQIKVHFADGWYDHPLFISALKARIDEVLATIPAANKDSLTIILSAHSLPISHIKEGDSYLEQLDKTVAALQNKLGNFVTKLAYQSKGGGQGEWLGPQVEEVIGTLPKDSTVLVVPIGFACDHIETLYDIDIAQRAYAQKCGINFYRAHALNLEPHFMHCLADVVLKKAKEIEEPTE